MTRHDYDQNDINAAVRGLGMPRLTRRELESLVARHATVDRFASQVIAAAARQQLNEEEII